MHAIVTRLERWENRRLWRRYWRAVRNEKLERATLRNTTKHQVDTQLSTVSGQRATSQVELVLESHHCASPTVEAK